MGSSEPATNWVRPADWLPMPDMSAAEGAVMLCAVWGDGRTNAISFKFSGAYQVNWGNGVTTTHAAGDVVDQLLVWDDYASSTLTSQGYRQALITVTPQAGQNLTEADWLIKHSLWVAAAGSSGTPMPYLDITARLPYANVLNFTGQFSPAISAPLLQRFRILAWGQITTLAGFFGNLSQLAVVELPQTPNPNLTTVQGMFANCARLISVTLFDTSQVTNFTSMFDGARSIVSVPAYNTAAGTTFNTVFRNCSALKVAPAFDYSKATVATNLFNGAAALEYVPPMHLPLCTNLTGMFQSTQALTRAPEITALPLTGVTMTNIFTGSAMLEEIPAWPVSGVTTAATPFGFLGRLRWFRPVGWNLALSITGTAMNAQALNLLYTNLSSSGAGKTVTITGALGAPNDNPSIATAKGWTVSG